MEKLEEMEKVKEALHIALANLGANAIRSILSVLGIVIGIAAVISILAIGAGAKKMIMDRINAMGANTISIWPMYDSTTARMGVIELEDVERIGKLPFVQTSLPRMNFYKEVRSRHNASKGSIIAIDEKYLKARELNLVDGRNISPIEGEQRAMICLINEYARQELFQDSPAIGEFLYIDGTPWQVVGVYGPKKQGYRDNEIEVLTPLLSLLRTSKDYSIEQVEVQVKPDAMSEKEAKETLLAEMEKNDPKRKGLFFIRDQKDMYARNLEIRKVLSLIGTIVAFISLIVGGIGMMNVMLTSVAERTREIGLRRAVGARKKDILIQFLVESCVLSLSGGILGLILGSAVARLLPLLFRDFFTSAPRLQPSFLFLSMGCGILMGVTFGFYPAVKASRLSPAEALRSE